MSRAEERAADRWLTVTADRALYADVGDTTVLCDRLPFPITLVLKNPAFEQGAHIKEKSDGAD